MIGGFAAFRAVSLWLTEDALLYEAMPPRLFPSGILNGGGVASDYYPVFGKPQAYRTESGKAAGLMNITVIVLCKDDTSIQCSFVAEFTLTGHRVAAFD